MPTKRIAAWALGALLLGAGGLLFWRRLHQGPGTAGLQVSEDAPEPAVPGLGLEAALRQLMPSWRLEGPGRLVSGSEGLVLSVPRRRDLKALAALMQSGLKSLGLRPDAPQWFDEARSRGFVLPVSGSSLKVSQSAAPGLALVIDDWGYHVTVLEAMRRFPGRLTVAVLPGLAHSAECAEAAFAAGHEVILHLPMEPEHPMPMLPGTLKPGMPEERVLDLMDRHASSVPHMSGLNNHEGSKGSADTALMQTVAAWLKSHGGYFLDSKTSPKSVGEREAALAGVPYASRRVFLDNLDSPAAIEKAFRQALEIAAKSGSCIAIGHPRKNTLEALTRLAPEAAVRGVELVAASELTLFP